MTAAFNLNLLVRINRELRGNFDLRTFAHRAVWNADQQRIEMHLVSVLGAEVSIPARRLDVSVRRERVDLDGELVQIHARTRLSTWARRRTLRAATSGSTRKRGLR